MTDTLRDLLRESVADAEMPDVAEVAWRSGARARRRRAVSAAAGVAAVALVVGGTAWVVDRRSESHGAAPVHRPSATAPAGTSTPYDGSAARRDGSYLGTSVWWSPRLAQEASLPGYPDSSLPSTIDVSQVGRGIPELPPVGRGVAAFTQVADTSDHPVLSVGVLGADGRMRLVDTSRVRPLLDPAGRRVDISPSMLSPTGEYLMFAQPHSVLVLTLATGRWRAVATGDTPTTAAVWASDDTIALPDPTTSNDSAPTFDVTGKRVGTTQGLGPRFDGHPSGPARSSGYGLARAYGAGSDVPQPPALHLSPSRSDWIGVASAPDAILVVPMEPGRQQPCCQVASWLDRDTLLYESRSSDGLRLLAWRVGTGRFWHVASVVGALPGNSVVSSYADLARQ